jgi:hypothetical protein
MTLAPAQKFRAEWKYFNCGETNWSAYKVARVEGAFGPEMIQIGNWPRGTSGAIWFEGPAPSHPGRYRLTYELSGPNGPFGRFWAEFGVVR